MSNEEMPNITTSFTVIQDLDGSVAVLTRTGLNQVREPNNVDVLMLCRYVADSVEAQLNRPPEPKTVQQTLQERLAERARQEADDQG